MTAFRAAAVQLRSGLTPADNIADTERLVRAAAADGARYVLTPEMTNIVDKDRKRLLSTISEAPEEPSLARLRDLARELSIVLHVGSLAVRLPGDRVANRAFVIAPSGDILATYDKLHMFDVDLGDGEAYRESSLYEAGRNAVVADAELARIGVSICYDVRFPQLYRALAREGAELLAVPAAFTRTTGQAHWEVLLRARAIESGAFVVAAAQGGRHQDGRTTWGHSMIVSPWGTVLAVIDDEPGFVAADIDLKEVREARSRIPALTHDRPFDVVTEHPGEAA